MSDEKPKMTNAERQSAASKRAREHIREIDQLRSEYVTSNEIREAHTRNLRELSEILGDLDQPLVGKECRTV